MAKTQINESQTLHLSTTYGISHAPYSKGRRNRSGVDLNRKSKKKKFKKTLTQAIRSAVMWLNLCADYIHSHKELVTILQRQHESDFREKYWITQVRAYEMGPQKYLRRTKKPAQLREGGNASGGIMTCQSDMPQESCLGFGCWLTDLAFVHSTSQGVGDASAGRWSRPAHRKSSQNTDP